ncbi:MAG: ATP synthase subunit alpha [Dehalococcoides mccartyi]|nr:ATP synthase subunit alpha [Dehalococcoides mccartyi]
MPIIETQAGDVSAYVPTNVISITDGQIYLEPDMFNAGIRPAVNVGISVSRVGSSAQTKAMKKVAGKLKMDMGQYRELAAFAQFGTSELDKATRMQLERGQRITEVLKQGQYQPVPMANQVAILYAALNGYLDSVEVAKVRDFESGLYRFLEANFASVLNNITKENAISAETETALKTALDDYKKGLVV